MARLDTHWAEVERKVAASRRTKDYVRRLLGDEEENIVDFLVTSTEVAEQSALSRRRRVGIGGLVPFITQAESELQRAARDRNLQSAGPPLTLFHEPVNNETDGEVEVCWPVSRSGDVVLPGGTFAQVDVRGEGTNYPQILSAYDAVASWAHQHQRPLLGPPREIYVDHDHFIVGWLVGSTPGETI